MRYAPTGQNKTAEGGQVLAAVRHAWGLSEQFKCIEQFFDPAIGSIDIVRSDVFPDIVQIEISVNTEDVAAHVRGLRRSPDLRFNRARASPGSTVSPRSNDARR